MTPVILLVALLAACGQKADTQPANDSVTAHPAPQPKAAPPTPKAFAFDEKNDLIDFHYGWSAEAAAVPQLVERFRKDMGAAKSKLLAGAKEDKAFRDKEGMEFPGHMSSTEYETAGQSAHLLSLRGEVGAYTGGAHGNYGISAILWDRSAAKEIKDSGLFAEAANRDRLLTQSWCDALNKAREEKRDEPVGGDGLFDDCPKLDEIAVIPTDKDRNGRFERLVLVAAPYVAGAYAEGSYEIDLAVTPDLVAALRNEYRTDFEAGQVQ